VSNYLHITDILIGDRCRNLPGAVVESEHLKGIDPELFDKKEFLELEELAASIEKYGLLHPIVIDDDNRLVAGMRRLCAHVLNKQDSIEVKRLGELSEIELRTIELEENVRRLDLRWDDRAKYIAEIDRLKREEFGSTTGAQKVNVAGKPREEWSQEKTAALVGYDKASISRAMTLANALNMMPELSACKSADEAQKKFERVVEMLATKELIKRTTEEEGTKDQKFLLDMVDRSYTIGNCLAGMADMAGNNSGLILAEVDPPYGIDLKALRQGEMRASYNEIGAEDYPGFLLSVAKEVYRVLDTNAWCIWWFGHEWQGVVYNTLCHVGFEVDKIPCAWVKNKGQTNQPDKYLARGWEPFYICRKGKPVLHKRGRLNVFIYPGVPDKQRTHDTERPFDLIHDIVSTLCLPKSGVVLVPFLGSGNTIRAALAHGMKAIGWDINGEEQKLALIKKVLADFEDVSGEGNNADIHM
jgi:ParB family chromosome partitioning protein